MDFVRTVYFPALRVRAIEHVRMMPGYGNPENPQSKEVDPLAKKKEALKICTSDLREVDQRAR